MQENVPIEEVFQTLRCNSNGLTTEAAEHRLAIFGYNKLEEKKVWCLWKFLQILVSTELNKVNCFFLSLSGFCR